MVAEGETTRGGTCSPRSRPRPGLPLVRRWNGSTSSTTSSSRSSTPRGNGRGRALLHESGNVLSRTVIRRGDVDAALASSAHVLTETFTTQRIEHAFLEPEAAPCAARSTRACGCSRRAKAPGRTAVSLASLLGVAPGAVRVTQVPTGGAFGGKEDLGAQGPAALLAWHEGRPVRLRRHAPRACASTAPPPRDDLHGRLRSRRHRSPPYGRGSLAIPRVRERRGQGPGTGRRAPAGHIGTGGRHRVAGGLHEQPAVRRNAGFGVPQVTFAMDGMLDRLAERVGLDGWRSAGATPSSRATAARPGSGWAPVSDSRQRCWPCVTPTATPGSPGSVAG